jgi:hypothetical protein
MSNEIYIISTFCRSSGKSSGLVDLQKVVDPQGLLKDFHVADFSLRDGAGKIQHLLFGPVDELPVNNKLKRAA